MRAQMTKNRHGLLRLFASQVRVWGSIEGLGKEATAAYEGLGEGSDRGLLIIRLSTHAYARDINLAVSSRDNSREFKS